MHIHARTREERKKQTLENIKYKTRASTKRVKSSHSTSDAQNPTASPPYTAFSELLPHELPHFYLYSLLDRDGALGSAQDGLQPEPVAAHHDAHDPLLVGDEQYHRDVVLNKNEQERTKQRREERVKRPDPMASARPLSPAQRGTTKRSRSSAILLFCPLLKQSRRLPCADGTPVWSVAAGYAHARCGRN